MRKNKHRTLSINKTSLIIFTLIAFLSALTHWKIFENDLFWQIRAGEEIFQGSGIQTIDTWSSTAYGQSWRNFQWLSTTVFYWVYNFFEGYTFLPTLRFFLNFLIFTGMYFLIRNQKDKDRFLFSLLLLPLSYIVCSGRLQLRPDIFAILCFTWMQVITWSRIDDLHKISLQLLLLLLWSNFHSGTYPIGAFVFSVGIFFAPISRSLTFLQKALTSLVAILIWWVSPQGWNVLDTLLSITVYYDWTLIMNPDHQPLSLSLFSVDQGGWIFWIWLIGCLAAFFQLRRKNFPNRGYWLMVGLALFALTVARMRVRVYSWIFLLPLIVSSLDELTEKIRNSFASGKQKILAYASFTIIYLGFLPHHISTAPALGFGIDQSSYPVFTASFLKKHTTSPRFLNAYAFGGYLIQELRDYPVAQDGREYIFSNLFKDTSLIQGNAEKYADFLEKHKFETLLVRAPHPSTFHAGEDIHSSWYPKSIWALVDFDDASILYLKRIPEHEAIIQEFEYKNLSRTLLPINASEEMKDEIEHCLSVNPNSVFCLMHKAFLEKKSGNESDALANLEKAQKIDPKLFDSLL